jgi:hypothetical protein
MALSCKAKLLVAASFPMFNISTNTAIGDIGDCWQLEAPKVAFPAEKRNTQHVEVVFHPKAEFSCFQ